MLVLIFNLTKISVSRHFDEDTFQRSHYFKLQLVDVINRPVSQAKGYLTVQTSNVLQMLIIFANLSYSFNAHFIALCFDLCHALQRIYFSC
jgi:hypothetical protein